VDLDLVVRNTTPYLLPPGSSARNRCRHGLAGVALPINGSTELSFRFVEGGTDRTVELYAFVMSFFQGMSLDERVEPVKEVMMLPDPPERYWTSGRGVKVDVAGSGDDASLTFVSKLERRAAEASGVAGQRSLERVFTHAVKFARRGGFRATVGFLGSAGHLPELYFSGGRSDVVEANDDSAGEV